MIETSKEIKFYASVGQALSDAREKVGFTQEFVSNKIGLSRASIVNIEKGRQRPSVYLLFHFAELYDLTISDLFAKVDQPFENNFDQFTRTINSKAESGLISEDSLIYLNKVVHKNKKTK